MKRVNYIVWMLVFIEAATVNLNCFSQKTFLKAGIAKVDITPKESLFMGGYDETCRSGPSDGSYGNIYIRALVFDDNISRIVFIETDVVSLLPEDYLPIRKLITEKTGIQIGRAH